MVVENYQSKVSDDNDHLPEKVEESIKKIIKKEGYVDYTVQTKAVSTVGGNYFGSLYEVDVKGKTEDGEKETNIFVKSIVPGDHLTVFSDMFYMELFVYNDLAVAFYEMQTEANVPAGERYNMAKAFQESIPEAIILENLSRNGYKTVFRMDPISLKFAELSVQQLGRLHGLSFALETRRPDYFERKIKRLTNPYKFNDDFHGVFRNSSKAVAECLDDDARKRLTEYLPILWNNVQRYLFDAKYKRTIVHNDYRANNILLKEIDGKIVNVIPVDYQLLHYGCPVIDFLYFIFLGTDQQFRKDHLDDLKDIYFDSLTKIIKYFNINVKSVFPREDFEELYNEMLGFGLQSFIQITPFMFAVEDEIPELEKLDKDSLSDVTIKTDPRMKERARGLVDDFIRWGVL